MKTRKWCGNAVPMRSLPTNTPGCDEIKSQNSVNSYRSKSAAKEQKRLEMKLSTHRAHERLQFKPYAERFFSNLSFSKKRFA